MTLRLAWFATARGTSSRLLFNSALDAIRAGSLDAEIVCVVCNRAPGQSDNTDAFLADVNSAGIPLIAESSRDWRRRVGGELSTPGAELAPWRRDFDRSLLKRLRAHAPDAAMLAGYMLVLSDVICDALPCLNLHPALPDGPIGTWQQVIHELIREQAERSGLVLQRVTTELDRGPTVTWMQYPIRGPGLDDLWRRADQDLGVEQALFDAIRKRGVARESAFVLESLQAIASNPTLLDHPHGADITEAVERAIAEAAEQQ